MSAASSRCPTLDRRRWLLASATGLAAAALVHGSSASAADGAASSAPSQAEPDAALVDSCKRDLVRRLLYARGDIDDWLAGRAFPFSKYDPELGYLHIDRDFKEGVDGSVCTYRYDASGARHMSAYAERACRVNTYGNSFTSCEQVSDGESWQEVLASHLQEPVRNFGIGGYSVYQAYLRMLREERRLPSKVIVFNIFDDDHYRNLHGWQRPRFRVNRKSTNPPVPHVKFDPAAGTFVECPNPCPTPEALYQLCEFDSAWKLFADDFAVENFARRERGGQGAADVPESDFDDPLATERGLAATQYVIDRVEQFAAQNDRRVLYVLSYGGERVHRFVKDQSRFDRSLVEMFDRRKLPYVDLLAAHAADYRQYGPDLDAYLKRYYIGHYNPLGNFFCAFAIKDRLVAMLDPPPRPYAPGAKES